MKATLEFKLPKDETVFIMATKANNMANVLWDWSNYLRGIYKYSEEDIDGKYSKTVKLFGITIWQRSYTLPNIEDVRAKWYELLNNNDINLDTLLE